MGNWPVGSRLRRVLLVLPRLEIGGGERAAIEVISGLLARGIQVTLIVVIAGGPMERQLPDGTRIYRILYHGDSDAIQNPMPIVIRVLSQLGTLLKIARSHDLVLASGEFGGSLYLGALLSMVARRPLVGWAHGEAFKMASLEYKWRGAIHRRLLRYFYPIARRVIAVSEHSKRDLIAHLQGIDTKVEVVYLPVPIDDIVRWGNEPVPPEYDGWFELPVVVSLGRHEWRKGFDVLISAHAMLKYRGLRHRLLILGPEGPETEFLRALARELGVQDSVKLSGYVSNPFPFIKASTVFAFPSRSEGFGLALVEAMALGKPVVVSETAGGAVDIVERGQYGLVVPSEDPDALAGALERLLCSPEERAYWAKKASERSRFFKPERFMERFVTVLEEVYNEFWRAD